MTGVQTCALPISRVIAHSQGTNNTNQALVGASDVFLRRLSVFYLGTAVNTVPTGLGAMTNINDRGDLIAFGTGGSGAIARTFRDESVVLNPLWDGTPSAASRVPPNYRTIATDFNSDRIPDQMPSGNNHSLYLYLMRTQVQNAMQLNLRVNPIPPYTGTQDVPPT